MSKGVGAKPTLIRINLAQIGRMIYPGFFNGDGRTVFTRWEDHGVRGPSSLFTNIRHVTSSPAALAPRSGGDDHLP